ncbi:oxygenase MpaB family protein [Leifsonia sp. McL0607]|uniref:oxygenase MpaB family protein n=1 Tax=Leifsonia sp. McL0607 TaxID=3415672 RepID=UPI003CE6B7E7
MVADPYEPFRLAAQRTHSRGIFFGFMAAYYRSFAVPHVAKQLVEHGEILRNPDKRASDTGIVIYEVIQGGFDSPRATSMVELLRRVHRRVVGSSDDYMFALVSQLVTPVRFTRTYGRTPLAHDVVEAGVAFYTELGSRMGIAGLPRTFAEWEEFHNTFENEHVAQSVEGLLLMERALPGFRARLPAPMRWLGARVLSAAMQSAAVSEALGLPVPERVGQAVLKVMTGRGGSRETDFFVPGQSSRSYPLGYGLGDVGPESRSLGAADSEQESAR